MVHTETSLSAAQTKRYGATIDLHASGDKTLNLEAGAVRSIGQGKTVYVRAEQNFYVEGELIAVGDFVPVSEQDAKRLVGMGRGTIATDAEVAAAAKAGK